MKKADNKKPYNQSNLFDLYKTMYNATVDIFNNLKFVSYINNDGDPCMAIYIKEEFIPMVTCKFKNKRSRKEFLKIMLIYEQVKFSSKLQ